MGYKYSFSGSWTPVIQFGGASTGITYSTQLGSYAVKENLISIRSNLQMSSKGSATGNATITGVPIPSNNTANQDFYAFTIVGGAAGSLNATYSCSVVELPSNSSTLSILQYATALGTIPMTNANFTNPGLIRNQLFYFS